ncbi:zinc finger CW-type PWWP domain protein 1 isoform X2 [Peromyscus maniculatus bairdii]|uniref:zinc finger CW-type PWWP domain protein 1 isoform X2 n=1 Tax=Peromyscus maniculatus bairdii TaxID=230844 RepID=UPI001C2E8DB4|nr:zinc finger CW-type PWWP domain protein 1 isoform X2 [Peromyscus maniculatus bairdii]
MMATLQNYEESEKGTKKTFAPPTQKPHIVKPQPKSWKEETLGTSSPEAEAKPSRPKASSKKREQKTATEHGPSGGQEKKQKAQDKPAEKKGKSLQEKPTLTNAEFEEIFQSVLQKSLQECLGLGSGLNFAETSCAQPIIPTKSDREPGIAPSADNENADGEKVIVPDTPEIASSLEEEVSSETRTSKSGQPVTEPSKKKFNRLFSSKRKKKADEKIQDGHECSLKAKQKTMIQDHSQIRGQQKEEEGGFGQCLIWVQCSSPKCEKWRQLRGGIDPSVLPDNWSCDQNPDLNYNRCDIPEETWTGCESDVAYASYVPGSIIWAKQYGYPWWPGMIESDPDLGEYFLFASHLDSLPSKYHVTYFGETVSRAWIPVSMLKNFQELSLELARVKKCKNKDYGQKLEAAIRMAHKAEQISVQERVNLFGFWSRYNGSDGSGEGKDLMVCEPSRPECCLEKEKDSEEEKEEKEEKKDPTLPRPKPAKIQTKKTKSRGPSGGPAGTSKEKTVKKSLGSESAVPPGPIMGGKEEQGNLDLDHPGPKKKFKTPESKASATELPKEKAIKTDSKCPAPPAPHGACPLGKEGPGPQEPLTQEAASFPPEDDGSSDLDLEQLMEDIGEAEERGESQQRDGSEEFLAGLFEE